MTDTNVTVEKSTVQDDVALIELAAQLDDLNAIVNEIIKLRGDNLFRYLSKTTRNTLLNDLIEKSGAVEDASRAAFRAIKKIKRERLPEEVADLLLSGRRNLAIICKPQVNGTPIIDSNDDE
jgi:hypothetical protein